MLTYTNHLKRLVLPEYGRNIQQMVDHCVTIEDRDERTRCAHTIIEAMLTLFPSTGDATEYRRKLWDHLMIMSDFTLDVDTPFEHIERQTLNGTPDAVPIERPGTMPFRYYGKYLPQLIDKAAAMEEGEERDALVLMIANQMKKTLIGYQIDNVEDARVFEDLRNMSHGAIRLDTETVRLQEFKQAPAPTGKKKKKR